MLRVVIKPRPKETLTLTKKLVPPSLFNIGACLSMCSPFPRVLIVNRSHQFKPISGFNSFQPTFLTSFQPNPLSGLFLLPISAIWQDFFSIPLKLHKKSCFCVGTCAVTRRSFKWLCCGGGLACGGLFEFVLFTCRSFKYTCVR